MITSVVLKACRLSRASAETNMPIPCEKTIPVSRSRAIRQNSPAVTPPINSGNERTGTMLRSAYAEWTALAASFPRTTS
jgi:hypothetical protein